MLTTQSGLVLAAMLLPFTLMAQHANMRPGYYVTLKGDTVKCNIEVSTRNRTPSVIRVAGNNGSLELRPEETKGFGLYGLADFASANVTYHTEKITGTDLPAKYSEEEETAWCFLKLLVAGDVALYELTTNQRIVFFISDHGDAPTELLYRVAVTDGQLKEDQHYKQILLRIFNKQNTGENFERRIERISYKEGDLTMLVKRLNTNAGRVYAKGASGEFDCVAFAGEQAYLFPSSFNGAFSVNNHFSPALSPFIGVGLLYNITPYSGKFSVGLSADYSTYNATETRSGVDGHFYSQNFYDTAWYTERLHGSNAFATLRLFLQYVVNPDAKVKFYLKGGVWYSLSVKKETDIYSDYTATNVGRVNGLPPATSMQSGQQYLLGVSKSFGNILADGGVRIGKNQFELAYGLPSFTGRFNGTGTKFKIGTASLSYGYVFGKRG
jgi:hypothetical protein